MSRRLAPLTAVAGIAALTLPAAAAHAAPPSTGSSAETTAASAALARHGGHGLAGRLLTAKPLARSLWPAGTASAYRVTYLSTGQGGRPTVVTGSVFVPSAAYRGGSKRPVVSWAHETTGVADNCAPSRLGNPEGSRAALAGYLSKGYVVAESDYQGLGTPGQHPFLIGRSEAHGVIDIVRATRQLHGVHASRKWLVAGHSQGGQAALFVGSMAATYGRGLDFRGTVSTAPATQWRMTLDQTKPFRGDAPGNPFLPLILSGIDTVSPKLIDEGKVLTPEGQKVYRQVRTNMCYHPLQENMQAKPGNTFYHLDDATLGKLEDALDTYAEVPVAKYTRPVFMAQGTADTTVYPLATQTTATKLSQAGTNVDFKFYPGATHGTVEQASLESALAWAERQLAS